MTLKKSTYYALCAALELARASGAGQVTAARVARRHGIPEAVLAKVFQQLVHKGLAVGTRGTGGGYSLARRPSEVTVLDVIDVFEAAPDAERLQGPLRELFDAVDERARGTFASVTLDRLAGNSSGDEPGIQTAE